MIVRSLFSRSIHFFSSSDPGANLLMIDVKARQHEKARDPEDHEDDVCCLDPGVAQGESASPVMAHAKLSRANQPQQLLDMCDWRVRQDAMPQIEDVRTIFER